MMNDPLAPNILTALANAPRWTAFIPAAKPTATAAATTSDSTLAPPGTMEGSSTKTPPDARYVAVICPRCGGVHHLERCPQVKSIEYHEDGRTIKRVEFHEPPPPATPRVTTNVAWHSIPLTFTVCPRCNGNGREPFYLPLATDPIAWTACELCHGHGFVDNRMEMIVTTATTAYQPPERGDEEE